MNKIRTFSQTTVSWCLAIYIGVILNLSVFYQRFNGVENTFQSGTLVGAICEVVAVLFFSFFLFRLLSLGGKVFFRITASLVALISVAASYYMTIYNVTIGYGIVASVMTTDIDLSKEVMEYTLIPWIIGISIIPLALIWLSKLQGTLLEQLKTPGQRIKNIVVVIASAALVWLPLTLMDKLQSSNEHESSVDLASYSGVVAHSYLPVNWLASLGLWTYSTADEMTHGDLIDPAKQFTYNAPADIDDTYVIFIIGETARWDHMGMLGYERDTTPLLAKEPNLVAFKGESCDTATKLSLRCMFVREGGVKDNPQRTVLEKNIFAVMKELGFSSELFAMQSEVWFYNSVMANDYRIREMIASEQRNKGKTVDDMILVGEVKNSLEHHPKGKHLIILHTKGSHYLYTKRYPREFANFQPECMGVEITCSKRKFINAFDNSILYTDYFIKNVIDQVRDKNALVFYASDHGESIVDVYRFHGTPREVAPPEQFRVPMMVWASDSFLKDEKRREGFEQLKAEKAAGSVKRHEELFDSILGCLGYTSPNGGINPKNNWCARP